MANAKHTTVVESTFFLAVWSTKACEQSRFSLLLAAKHWQNVPGGEELEETTVFAGFGRPVIHRSPGAHFSPVGQGRDLALGQRHCTRILVLVLGKRVLIISHPFMQTLTNQKSRTVSSWFLTGLNLHETM